MQEHRREWEGASQAYQRLAADAMDTLGLGPRAALAYVSLRQAGTGHSVALGYVQRKYAGEER